MTKRLFPYTISVVGGEVGIRVHCLGPPVSANFLGLVHYLATLPVGLYP
jgi:hypothetical protein